MGKNKTGDQSKSIWRDSYYALIIFLILVLILSILNGGLFRNLNILLISLFFLVATTILFVAIFSQFALPVKNYRQRILAFIRIISYLIGRHGPAIFIENGKLRERKDGRLRKRTGCNSTGYGQCCSIKNTCQIHTRGWSGNYFSE